MVKLAVIAVALTTVGCAGSLSAAKVEGSELGAATASPERCADLDDSRRMWGGIAKGSGLVAGGAGVGTIPSQSSEMDVGLAIGAVVMGAVAAGANYVAEGATESWVRECGR